MSKATHRWPRIKKRRDSLHVVSGWYAVQWRFAVLQKLCRIAIGLLGLLLLILAALPFFVRMADMFPEGGLYWDVLWRLVRLRQGAAAFTIEHLGWLANLLWINPSARYSWKLAVAGIIVYRLGHNLATPSARLLTLVVPVIVKRPVRVRIDSDYIRFRKLGFPFRFKREPGLQIQFLSEHQHPGRTLHPGQDHMCSVVMRYGHRKVVLCGSMHERDAERLSLGLSYARDQADGVDGAPGAEFAAPFAF